jgi:hypothetical protein
MGSVSDDSVRRPQTSKGQTLICLLRRIDVSFKRPFRILKPAIPKHCVRDARDVGNDTQDRWCAYPASVELQASYYREVFDAETSLAELTAEAMQLCCANGSALPDIGMKVPARASAASILYRDLQRWKTSLPEALQPGRSQLPSVLLLQYVSAPLICP